MVRNSRSGVSRRRFLGAAGAGAAAGVIGAAMYGSGVAHAAAGPGPTLETVKANKKLNVAVAATNGVGFYEGYNRKGRPVEHPGGLEADLARALAVAIFGVGERKKADSYINYVGSSSTNRWYYLFGLTVGETVYEQVDVVIRSITNTLTRDVYQGEDDDGVPLNSGCTFCPTYYYDGADVLVSGAKPLAPPTEPEDYIRVAVGGGTTTEDVIDGAILQGLPFKKVEMYDSDEAKQAFLEGYCIELQDPKDDETDPDNIFTVDAGECISQKYYDYLLQWNNPDDDPLNTQDIDAWASDTSGLIGAKLADIPDSYRFMAEFGGGKLLSKEPLAPAVVEGDPNWADIVTEVINVLFEAEEQGITSNDIRTAKPPRKGQAPSAAYAFGRTFDDNWNYTGYVSPHLGLVDEWPRKVVQVVGNFAEIWDRNFRDDAWYPRGANNTWKNGGLIYGPAFR